jgi:hypothetical protein
MSETSATGMTTPTAIRDRAAACEDVYLSPLATIVVREDVPWLLDRHAELYVALKHVVEHRGGAMKVARAAIAKSEGR